MPSPRFVAFCDDSKSFSFLFLFLFRQVVGGFPEENDKENEERCGRKLFPTHPSEIDPCRQRAEEPGRKVHPELVERHGIMAARPDDEHVFGGNQDPADENQTLDLRGSRHAMVHVHVFDEGVLHRLRLGWPTGDELDEVGEHGVGDGKGRTSRRKATA